MKVITSALLLVAMGAIHPPADHGGGPALSIKSAPERPIIETRNAQQFVNFDLEISSRADVPLLIAEIDVSVYDASGHIELKKSVNTDAFAPSIGIIGERLLAPGQTLDVFNPFNEFGPELKLSEMRFSFCLQRQASSEEAEKNRHRLTGDCDLREELSVRPQAYVNKTALTLPLRGTFFVWEGHDFLAHHFRVPLGQPRVQALGITANSNEFASDFIYVDGQGRPFHDDARNLENWYGYGKAIFAPGCGVIVAAADDIPENRFLDGKGTVIGYPKIEPERDPKQLGNFVLIDHLDGEYSLLLHMRPGSVLVKQGDHVKQGQMIGSIGFSGDSIFPHLHYSLMAGREVSQAWGLPAYFLNFRRVLGSRSLRVDRGPVEWGDFVQNETGN